ncbi:MAG: hypothetical protein N3B01_10810, partial [Verrucomicrobiae bacterium]|nr:hypothetical protein [Verrucomicrobiae bacterium]
MNPLPGFRDFYPEALAIRQHIFGVWRETARRYGFREYDGPPVEPLELYTLKSGEEIVRQLFLNGCIDSGYWHRFSVTTHSPIGKNPESYGIK